MQKRTNRSNISLPFFVKNSCKAPAQTTFTDPNRKQDQATLSPVYLNYFFDVAETTSDSTIVEDIFGFHNLVSNGEPIHNENNAISKTSSMKKPLCQQSFEAQMSALGLTSIHEYDR